MPVFRLFHLRISPDLNDDAQDAVADAMINGHVSSAVGLGLYDEAARIEAPVIHELFRLSNSIDRHWSENPGILACAPRARSTMMGDLVLDEQGRLHACARVGWEPQPDRMRDAFLAEIGLRVAEIQKPLG